MSTLEGKVPALTIEVEGVKQRLALAEPVAAPQEDPLVTKMLGDAEAYCSSSMEKTLSKMMPDSTDASLDNSRGLTTLERMRRGEQVGGGPPRLPAISGIPEHAFQPVRLTPPRVEPRVETLAQPRPVIPPAETEKKAIATSCSQFNDERIQANVERIQAEARRNAPKSQVEAIEVEVTDEAVMHEKYREAQERLARLRAQVATSQEQQ